MNKNECKKAIAVLYHFIMQIGFEYTSSKQVSEITRKVVC